MNIPYNPIFNFIKNTCKQFDIDESHGIKHSMEVFDFSYSILQSESKNNPDLLGKEKIIYTAALLHDMCDNKYINEEVGWNFIYEFLKPQMDTHDIDISKKIIMTMSYSKVKKNGFPDMNEFQTAYHIVRESDLLTAYDIDRCIVFNMNRYDIDYIQSITDACNLYTVRMKKHIVDNLFTTNTGLSIAKKLTEDSDERVDELLKILE